MFRRWITITALCLTLLVAGRSSARAQDEPPVAGTIEIQEIEWGFDGKSPARMFVPLSVLVANNGPTPATGTLRLSKFYGRNQRVDADFEQTYFVSGFSSRWIQMTPYVLGDYESWKLNWGPQFHNEVDVPTPRIGGRATVLIAEADDASAVGSVLRRCDPVLFPVSVTATDSLRGVVLHAVPNWQGARVQAFREWLERGGQVYLLHGANGEYPKFSGELTFLNDAQEEFRVGAGLVKRLPLPVDEIDADTAWRQILRDSPQDAAPDNIDERMQAASLMNVFPVSTDFDETLLRDLQSLTRFKRNWWIVYLAAVLYVAAIFPGSYLLGRRVADWRWFYAGFLGIAVVFSAGFARLGQLGSAEQSRTRSVAVAYQVGDGLYDVMQWTCAASRDGDLYQLTNAGSGRLFSSCQETEAVNGVFRQQDGTFELDMPPASTCRLLQRARMPGPALGLQVASLQVVDGALKELTLSFAPDVYDKSMIVSAWHKGSVYELTADAAGARLANGRRDGAGFINTFGAVPWQAPRGINIWNNLNSLDIEPESTTEAFQMLLGPLTGTTLHLTSATLPHEVVLDPSIVRLLIYRPLPEEFHITGDQFPDQEGYVLYVIDLPSPSASP